MDTHIDPDLARELAAVERNWEGHLLHLQVKAGRIVGIQKFAYTYAILADITPTGYGDRWCYRDLAKAKFYLDAWTGEDSKEPQGWHRAVDGTGRRRHEDGREYIMP